MQIGKTLIPSSVSNFARHFLLFFVFLNPFYRFLSHFFLFYYFLHPVSLTQDVLCRKIRSIRPFVAATEPFLGYKNRFWGAFASFQGIYVLFFWIIACFLRYFSYLLSVFLLSRKHFADLYCFTWNILQPSVRQSLTLVLFHVKHFNYSNKARYQINFSA